MDHRTSSRPAWGVPRTLASAAAQAPHGPLRLAVRAALSLAILAVLLVLLRHRLDALDLAALSRAFASVAPGQWLAALALTAVSFAAVGRYDAVLHRHLRSGLPDVATRRTGMAAIAVSQTLGLGLITGALVRWRLLPGLTLWQATRISATVALSFLGGWAMLTSLVLVALPGAPFPGPALAVLALGCGLAAVSLAAPRWPGFRWPNALVLGPLLVLTAVDCGAAALALHLVCPPDLVLPLTTFLPAFLLAQGAGLLSGAPAGLGAFEMVLLALLPGQPEAPLLAAVLVWRAVYYALPALMGAALTAVGPRSHAQRPPPPNGLPDAGAGTTGLAETGLAQQGHLQRAPVSGGALLLGRSPHVLVALRDPAGQPRPAAVLAALHRMARAEARIPCLYKCGPRMAMAARHAGWPVLRIEREAVLHPDRFRLDRPDRAGLRRKLRKAASAGVTVSTDGPLPVAAMASLATAWARAHGGERGFSMGRYDPAYVAGQRVFLAWQGERLVGFATFHHGAGQAGDGEWALDLMRAPPDAPPGTMQALVVAALSAAAAEGIARLSLAALPWPPEGLPRSLNRLIARRGAGLARFKTGFAPAWTALYIAAPTYRALLLALAEIAREVHWPAPLPATSASPHDHHEDYEFASASVPWQRS